jgi:hypothetical protein
MAFVLVLIMLAVGLGVFVSMFALLYWAIARKGRRAADDLSARFGDRIVLSSGCGIVSHDNRVAGVLALLDDRLVFQSTIVGTFGQIDLSDITAFTLEPTSRSSHRRARKYRNATVLSLTTKGAEQPLFVIPNDHAEEWESALSTTTRCPE